MTGRVVNDDALLSVAFIDPLDRGQLSVEFVIDTGFKGQLTLSSAVVDAMALPLVGTIQARLADDSVIETNVHEALIRWHGEPRLVSVIATGARPLLGTQLLAGSVFHSVFEEKGPVTITPIPGN